MSQKKVKSKKEKKEKNRKKGPDLAHKKTNNNLYDVSGEHQRNNIDICTSTKRMYSMEYNKFNLNDTRWHYFEWFLGGPTKMFSVQLQCKTNSISPPLHSTLLLLKFTLALLKLVVQWI